MMLLWWWLIRLVSVAISYPPTLWQLHWALHDSTCNMSGNSTDFHCLSCPIMSQFMCELYHLLCIKVAASTAYHPQTNGQTECVNQELEQYLCVFVNERQDDWDEWLPMAEFAYNNHIHSSTQHMPFFIDTGQHPHMGFEPVQSPTKVEAVLEFVNHMKDTLSKAQAALAKSKDDMAHYYSQCRMPAPMFAAGDKVFLDASNIHMTCPSKKLLHCFLSPFPVVHPVGSHAYCLQLPPSMSCIHPVFHVVKLMLVPNDLIR